LSDYQADDRSRGEVAEWSNVAVSKTVEGASLPRVRIPVSPPIVGIKSLILNAFL
jgi:hypothetical protein